MGMTKKVWNFFTIAQWEEEEQWLNEMARNGYNLIGVKCFVRYIFEQGTPGEYIYKLDLPDNLEHGMDDKAYCNFLAECGIDVVCKQKQWLFLRKKAADGPFNEQGDMFAKLKMTNKAYSYAVRILSRLLRTFAILIFVDILVMCLIGYSDILAGIVNGISIGAIFALTIVWVPLMDSLRKKMNTLVNEIGVKH
ncbi:MAG: DUF2812 domain-containing protein [Alistipes sp.]|nr:DUF2812 domain-containing protein [Alistipes sp.]